MVPTVWPNDHPLFPRALDDVATPPTQLYTLGDPQTLDAPRVAIVGTRRPTPYGERITHLLASTLAEAGACIVSGMALGIDSCAHHAALKVQGRTVAVLGTGIDQIYPLSNRTLYHQLTQRGLVVSEYGPGQKAFRGCFPRRNRIVAGLSELTIVVEAGPKSGTLVTVQYALDANRTVAAVPGPIDAPNSYTPNHLIRDGAHIIATVDDALALLSLHSNRTTNHTTQPQLPISSKPTPSTPLSTRFSSPLTPDESHILSTLSSPGFTTDTLIPHINLPVDRCLAALTTLELRGLIQTQLTGEIVRL